MYDFYRDLIVRNNTKIVLLVLDGLGGLARTPGGETELAAASTPNLDRLAGLSTCGLMEPVLPGITPGSGPSHMSLFGYDPLKYEIGRGVLEALGSEFPVQPGDLCVRINFATADGEGKIVDRRAGRIETSETERLCRLLQEKVSANRYEIFFHPVKEHRAALVVRGPGLYDRIDDTDPQATDLPPVPLRAADPEKGKGTVELLDGIVRSSWEALEGERAANAMLLRGISFYHPLPTMEERYGLRSLALAAYPMYRGLAGLVGMTVDKRPQDWEQTLDVFQERWEEFDFFFLHFKKTDSTGEDGDFDRKVGVIEDADKGLPRILSRGPDVLAVTADHSTPSVLAAHSWHPVPVLINARHARQDGLEKFDELHCARGSYGVRPSLHLMAHLLAHAHRLKKYGA